MAVLLERERRLMSVFSAEEVSVLSNLLQRLRGHVSHGTPAQAVEGASRTASNSSSAPL
jgi:hypothetical protein